MNTQCVSRLSLATLSPRLRYPLLYRRIGRHPGACGILSLFLLALATQVGLPAASLDHFSWSGVPAEVQAGVPFAVSVSARDSVNGVVASYTGAVSISGLAPGVAPAVLITEVETLTTKRIEISNLSSAPVDVSGWRLVFYDSQTWPSPTTTFIVPAGTTCGARSVFQVRAGGSAPGIYPLLNLGVALSWGTSGSYPYSAVTLLDAAGRTVISFVQVQRFEA
jgi:hypothetical protein